MSSYGAKSTLTPNTYEARAVNRQAQRSGRRARALFVPVAVSARRHSPRTLDRGVTSPRKLVLASLGAAMNRPPGGANGGGRRLFAQSGAFWPPPSLTSR